MIAKKVFCGERRGWVLAGVAMLFLIGHAAFQTADAASKNKYGVAVIVGNQNYEDRIPDVEFAANDADLFKRFIIGVLGYDADNIIDLRDATQADLQGAFGNERTHEGKLWRYLDPRGRSDVTVFYSGHGVPGLKDKRGYLLPVDADPDAPEINGYPIDTLFANLSRLEARSVSVYLEACFSGDSQKGMLVRSVSGITISPKFPKEQSSQMTILTAAKGDQVASWDNKAKQGLFTRHLLDGLYGAADTGDYGNNDGKIDVAEIQAYLDEQMTRAARREYGRHQNAWIQGTGNTVLASVVMERPKSAPKPEPKPKPVPAPVVEKPAPVAPPKKVVRAVVPENPLRKYDGIWVGRMEFTSSRNAGSDVDARLRVRDGMVSGEITMTSHGEVRPVTGQIDAQGRILNMTIKGNRNGYKLEGTIWKGTGKAWFGSWKVKYNLRKVAQN